MTEPGEASEPKPRISTRAKAIIAALTALVTLATGILTLRDQLFESDDGNGGEVGDITIDAEAKTRANRVLDALESCASYETGDLEKCDTATTLGATDVPIGSSAGSVEVDVTSGITVDLMSRSETGQVFKIQTYVTGEEVRTCMPPGAGGCPPDGRW